MSKAIQDFYVYILTNATHKVLYTGVTRNINKRLAQHESGEGSVFTKKYKAHKLVYLETFPDPKQAIAWEKTIKAGSRKKKLALINEQNPEWNDLGKTLR